MRTGPPGPVTPVTSTTVGTAVLMFSGRSSNNGVPGRLPSDTSSAPATRLSSTWDTSLPPPPPPPPSSPVVGSSADDDAVAVADLTTGAPPRDVGETADNITAPLSSRWLAPPVPVLPPAVLQLRAESEERRRIFSDPAVANLALSSCFLPPPPLPLPLRS